MTRRIYAVQRRGYGYESTFCLSWQTKTMAAPTLWYFDTLQAAVEAWRTL